MSEPGVVDPLLLARFTPFDELQDYDLLLLAGQIELRSLASGKQLFSAGDRDETEYYLVSGEIELTAQDGTRRRLAADSEQARRPLARLRPRQYTAVTRAACELLVISQNLLKALQDDGDSQLSMAGYVVDEVDSIEEAQDLELLADFRIALDNHRFILPSLPEIAMKVCRMISSDDADINRISALVNADPAIAAKLIRAANSPIFRGASQCDTTRNAIVRLGMKTTHQLVISFALKELFTSNSPALKKVMQKTWKDGVEVAALSFVIAKKCQGLPFDAEEVLLVGLLHNIGVLAALSYLDSIGSELINDPEQLAQTLNQLQARAGETVLQKWHFPPEFIVTALHVCDWTREHDGPVDMCDLVQVAKLHAYLRNHQPLPVAQMDAVPALARLPLGAEMGPRLTIAILSESREQISQTEALLGQ